MHPPFPSFAAIEIAAASTVREARTLGIALRTIQFAPTSEAGDGNLTALLVYETVEQATLGAVDGTNESLRKRFEEQLRVSQKILPFQQMPDRIIYEFDSHDNITKNYKGSYYLRLK